MWFALLPGLLSIPCGAQEDQAIPKELAQYVREAQKAGLKPPQIRENALKAGWPVPAVDGALASTQTGARSDVPAKVAEPQVVDMDAKKESAPSAAAAQPAQPQPQPETAAPAASAPAGPAPESGGTPPIVVKPQAEGVRADDYLIGEGDVLQVAVWGEPTASVQSATVRPDGKISMPLIKDVMVAGQTPAQVEKQIQEQLGKIIRTPDVTVIVAQINSKKIFLVGAVKREGPLKYTYRMTVLQAISEAGGLTDYAKRKEIYVLHTENGRQYRLPFNYNSVLKGEHMEQNILISPGDTIVVP
jgi:polysaccharide export outer membrane protein